MRTSTVCALWLECLHAYTDKTLENGAGLCTVHTEMSAEWFDFFLDLVWNHGDNPVRAWVS